MRLGLILLALLFVAFGVVFGALNGERIVLDFYFNVLTVPKGAAVLSALLVGWFVGGLVVYVSQVPRLRRRVKALAREARSHQTAARALVPVSAESSSESDA
jgi:putative membrane protein